MSAWPQAVWITKQLKKAVQQNFETNSNIGEYQDELNDWTEDLGQQQVILQQQIARIDSLDATVNPPIVAEDSNGSPSEIDPSQIHTNSIWFVLQSSEQEEEGGGT